MKKVLIVFGTRPEAIKMAPVILKMQQCPELQPIICVTGQHKEMLQSVLDIFRITPHINLDVMKANQSLSHIFNAVMLGTEQAIKDTKPDIMLVHGDVTSAVAAAMAGFYNNIPIHHVEAGLRTGDIYAPWPEEMNRKLVATMSQFHYAPTQIAQQNLLNENINPNTIMVTGNTVIDALLRVQENIAKDHALQASLADQFRYLDPHKRIILVTGHRRENFDGGLEQVCQALIQIANAYPDIQIIYPVHLNPKVKDTVNQILNNHASIFLVDPLDYIPFIYLMIRSYLIITDSGGIQEEAPSFGKPVLVTRTTTERPEAVTAGTVKLVGTDIKTIIDNVTLLLDNEQAYRAMAHTHNPYGDGQASDHIITHLKR
ncbi:MAG: UDP-N-acetylglucosamine 2-epimerase (non-hydrolyzing) [Alphaproteobacteria bacterium]|jgi:UDP-N-acetylglucosamine 2-epimerase (non-hydrolysing)